MISVGYNSIIDKKKTEISRLKEEINNLQSQGKNLSKYDILSFADLEQDRFLWAQNMEKMGKVTPDDIAITGLRYKREKLLIFGIALTFGAIYTAFFGPEALQAYVKLYEITL